MIRAAVAAMAILLPVAAQAGPAATVIGCPFTAAAIERALAHELVGLGRADERVAPVVVTCAADGVAQLVVATVPPLTRAIDLGDVPPALAPRVVALLLASASVAIIRRSS